MFQEFGQKDVLPPDDKCHRKEDSCQRQYLRSAHTPVIAADRRQHRERVEVSGFECEVLSTHPRQVAVDVVDQSVAFHGEGRARDPSTLAEEVRAHGTSLAATHLAAGQL